MTRFLAQDAKHDNEVALRLSHPSVFANPQCLSPSWYAVCRSTKVGRRRPLPLNRFGRRIVVWRTDSGGAQVADARCPHLGADLGQGTLDNGLLRCRFHRWAFDAAGRCVDTAGHKERPTRCLRTYATIERYGFIWCYVAGEPRFQLPVIPEADRFQTIRAPAQLIRVHPHVVIGNGLDLIHFESLHGMRFTQEPTIDTPGEHRIDIQLRGHPRSRVIRWLTGTRRRDIIASFTTVGGNLAISSVTSPLRMHVLFAAQPTEHGHALTQTIWFLPRGLGLAKARAVLLMSSLLHDDRKILERMDFHPSFAEADAPLRRFAEDVEAMGTA
ncbi:MAG: Rieske 2Fe-2S domain-containing protein [Phycisphaerae bacterium]|nr:Rieske 2Fe-2S domain-containing protein [Phycisphaerae bacterium]